MPPPIIKPCPICRHKPEIMDSNTNKWFAWCKSCDFDLAWHDRVGTILHWNVMASEGDERQGWLMLLKEHKERYAKKVKRKPPKKKKRAKKAVKNAAKKPAKKVYKCAHGKGRTLELSAADKRALEAQYTPPGKVKARGG